MVEERLAWVTLRLIAPGVQARSGRPLCSWHCCADAGGGRVGITDATTGGGVLVVLVLVHAAVTIATMTARVRLFIGSLGLMQASLRGAR